MGELPLISFRELAESQARVRSTLYGDAGNDTLSRAVPRAVYAPASNVMSSAIG